MIQNFFAKSFKAILFAIGLSLTIWRSHECLQKYSNSNLSTKVNMFNSFETVLPVIVICPSYMESYNSTNLNNIGIDNAEEYRNGKWYGNSDLDGTAILKYVTHEFSDLLKKIKILFKKGKKTTYTNDSFDLLNITEIGYRTFGRCFEIQMSGELDSLYYVDFVIKKSIYIYFGTPHNFNNADSKSKLEVKLGQKLYMDISYDILKSNFGENCKTYSRINDVDTYDNCVTSEIEKKTKEKFNCSVPFNKIPSLHAVCNGDAAVGALDLYRDLIKDRIDQCPRPCVNIVTYYGFPVVSEYGNKFLGYTRLYFKSVVKVTEDFISYDLLR